MSDQVPDVKHLEGEVVATLCENWDTLSHHSGKGMNMLLWWRLQYGALCQLQCWWEQIR